MAHSFRNLMLCTGKYRSSKGPVKCDHWLQVMICTQNSHILNNTSLVTQRNTHREENWIYKWALIKMKMDVAPHLGDAFYFLFASLYFLIFGQSCFLWHLKTFTTYIPSPRALALSCCPGKNAGS